MAKGAEGAGPQGPVNPAVKVGLFTLDAVAFFSFALGPPVSSTEKPLALHWYGSEDDPHVILHLAPGMEQVDVRAYGSDADTRMRVFSLIGYCAAQGVTFHAA
jgi:hypothetical protein